jgi:hypothetical protein
MVSRLDAPLRAPRQGVGRDDGARVVFHAVNAIGVGRQCPHARLCLQSSGQAQTKFASAPAFAFGKTGHGWTQGDRRFATAQNHARRLKRSVTMGSGARQRGVHFGNLAGFALNFI